MTDLLSADELRTLTGYRAAGRQDAWLTEQGIPHRRVAGRNIVSRSHVHGWLEGRPVKASNGPNWAALKHA